MSTSDLPASHDPTFGTFERVYYDYMRLLGETWDELVRRIMVAQQALGGPWMGGPALPGAAPSKPDDTPFGRYAEEVRAAWDESQSRFTAAYTNYLGAYRDAWASTGKEPISQQTIFYVMQSANAAAGYAATTIGNWGLISWAGIPPWLLTPPKP
jgi:hypothetical protein